MSGMMGFGLARWLPSWRMVGGLIMLVAVGGALWWQDHQIGRLRVEVEQVGREADEARGRADNAMAELARWEQVVGELRDEAAAARDATEGLQERVSEMRGRHRRARARVEQAPESDDGPLAPVLEGALQALRERSGQ